MAKWLDWAKELQSISQIGLEFAQNEFDIERYQAIRRIAAEILADNSGAEIKQIENFFMQESGYSTPKIDVRGAVFKDDSILMVKEISDGKWTLPGGWADTNETPSESVEREVLEESGYEVKTQKVAAILDRDKQGHFSPYPFHVYKIFFICKLTGGVKKTSIETSEVEFFKENDLPELSTRRILPHQVKRLFMHYRNPGLLADFD